jgi:hypothetical protein
MQLNTAFLLGFLLGLASLIGAAPGVAKHDPKQHPEYKCGKHEEGCNKIVKHNLMYLQRFAVSEAILCISCVPIQSIANIGVSFHLER